MKHCPKCGIELPDEAAYCSECGSPLKKKNGAWRVILWIILVPVLFVTAFFCYSALHGFLQGLLG